MNKFQTFSSNNLKPVLRPLSREQLAEILDNLTQISTRVGKHVVHCEALTINALLADIEANLLETVQQGDRDDLCMTCKAPIVCKVRSLSDGDGNWLCESCFSGLSQPE